MFYPFAWMVLSSFKTTSEIVAVPATLFPERISFAAYERIFGELALGRNFLNSVIVAGVSAAIAGVSSSMAGFVFAKFRFSGSSVLFFCLLAQMMIPIAVTVVPLYTLFTALGLGNSYVALVAPYLVSGFGIFLMRQFMVMLPREVIEAARLDGASNFAIYRYIAWPLTRTALAGVVVFTFLYAWTQFWWPLVVATTPDMRTLTQAVGMSAYSVGARYDVLAAGATLAVVPIVVVFVLAMRQVVASVTYSGLREG